MERQQPMRLDITDVFLRSLKPPAKGKRLILQDGLQPKLFLRVTATGACTWSTLCYLPNGRRVRPTLGQWPTLGISAARKQAAITAADVARGVSPTEVKREARRQEAARKGAPTVAARLAEWQEARAADWSHRYRTEVARLVDKMITPKLGKFVLVETQRDDWAGLIAAARKKTPATAAWLYGIASSFLNYGEAHGWAVNVLPRKGKGLLAPSVEARARVLSDGELARIWRAADQLTPKTRAFVRLLTMTAARLDEVANIALAELDRDAARWTIPAQRAKNRTAITLPLHPLLLAELDSVWPDAKAGADYRLLGQIAGSGFRSPSKLKRRIDKLSGVTGWRWHDLRRSARSTMSRLGIDARAAEAALNHVSDRSKLQRTYDRYDYTTEAIKAVEAWQAHVASLLAETALMAVAAA